MQTLEIIELQAQDLSGRAERPCLDLDQLRQLSFDALLLLEHLAQRQNWRRYFIAAVSISELALELELEPRRISQALVELAPLGALQLIVSSDPQGITTRRWGLRTLQNEVWPMVRLARTVWADVLSVTTPGQRSRLSALSG